MPDTDTNSTLQGESTLTPNAPIIFNVAREYLDQGIDDPSYRTDAELEEIINNLRSKSIEQDAASKQATECAKNGLNNLRNGLGLEKIPLDEIEVIFLNKEDFAKAYKDITEEDDAPGVAFASSSFKPVIIEENADRTYYVGATVFHELIHKYIDLYANVTAKINNESISETRRAGVAVQNISTGTQIGEIINELGNYACENGFIEAILKLEEFKWELEEKNQLLRNLGFEPGSDNSLFQIYIAQKDSSGEITDQSIQIMYEKKNIHFNKKNEIMWEETSSLIMQLASDLSVVCGGIEGKSFMKFLIECKRDPQKQNTLRRHIDEKVSKGFYTKLRRLEQSGDNIVSLIHEVQEKRYGIGLSLLQ